MKTTKIFSLILLFLATFHLNVICQIKVFNNNNVAINYNSTAYSRFAINAAGSPSYQAWIYSPAISSSGGALVTLSACGTGTGNTIIAHSSQVSIGTQNYFYGIRSLAFSWFPSDSGRAYGVYGKAGNATSGYNYGVYGILYGSAYGAAIFGSIDGLGDTPLTQQWAGYFRGDVKVENTLWVGSTHYYSDIKFKTNISSLESSETLSNIMKINPIKYNLKQFDDYSDRR